MNVGIVLLVFGTIIALSIQLFLRTLVTSQAQSLLSGSVGEIMELLEESSVEEEIAQRVNIQEVALNNNIQILISKDGEVLYNSRTDDFSRLAGDEHPIGKDQHGSFYMMYREQGEGENAIYYLVYRVKYTPEYEIEARSHYAAIETGLIITNSFSRLIIVSALILTLFWTLMFSRYFTRPVINMTHTARRLSELNFDAQCQVESDDELGELGRSINEMSDRLKEAYEKLREQNVLLLAELEKEKQLESMRKKFISDVSHELKTPLAIISGYAESLKLGINKSESKREEYAEVIIDETAKMTKLVHDLLNLSQYESGTYQLARSEFSIDALIRVIAERYVNAVTQKHIKLSVELDACDIFADSLRVEQIVNNFLSNAFAHVDDGRRIEIEGRIEGTDYRISVFNTGSHIPEDELAKIWDAFFKSDKARSRNEGRYGIGLSIVRALVELHGGTYKAENAEGGVRFTAALPMGAVTQSPE